MSIEKKKILFITPSLQQGGVEHSIITLLRLIDPKHFEVDLYYYVDKCDLLNQVPDYVNVIKGIDKTHYNRKLFSIIMLLFYYIVKIIKYHKGEEFFQRKLKNYIREQKISYPNRIIFKNKHYDVIISYCLHIGSEMALQIPAKQYYLFLHGSKTDYHQDIFERAAFKYNKIIAVSEGVKKVYSSKYPKIADKIITITNYVDADKVLQKSKEHHEITQELSRKWMICTCGRLTQEKGYNLAVEAAGKLKAEGISFIWYFIGDGDERATLEEKIYQNHLDQEIFITGFKENPYPLMKCCHIYVQPSYEESYGMAIKEALILQRLVVSTETVGAKCVLEEGRLGVLSPITSDELANTIINLMNDSEKHKYLKEQMAIQDFTKEKSIYSKNICDLLNGNL